jgi:hypothetical protein
LFANLSQVVFGQGSSISSRSPLLMMGQDGLANSSDCAHLLSAEHAHRNKPWELSQRPKAVPFAWDVPIVASTAADSSRAFVAACIARVLADPVMAISLVVWTV